MNIRAFLRDRQREALASGWFDPRETARITGLQHLTEQDGKVIPEDDDPEDPYMMVDDPDRPGVRKAVPRTQGGFVDRAENPAPNTINIAAGGVPAAPSSPVTPPTVVQGDNTTATNVSSRAMGAFNGDSVLARQLAAPPQGDSTPAPAQQAATAPSGNSGTPNVPPSQRPPADRFSVGDPDEIAKDAAFSTHSVVANPTRSLQRSSAEKIRDRVETEMMLTRKRVQLGDEARAQRAAKGKQPFTATKSVLGSLSDDEFNKVVAGKVADATEREENYRAATARQRAIRDQGYIDAWQKNNPGVEVDEDTARKIIEGGKKADFDRATNPASNPELAAAQAKNAQRDADRAKFGGDPDERLAGTPYTRRTYHERHGRAFGEQPIAADSRQLQKDMELDSVERARGDLRRAESQATVRNQVSQGVPVRVAQTQENELQTRLAANDQWRDDQKARLRAMVADKLSGR